MKDNRVRHIWTPLTLWLCFAAPASPWSSTQEIVDLNAEFREAARSGRFARFQELFKNPEVDLNARDVDGWTALMQAARSNRAEFIEMLIKGGAELDAQNHAQETALIIAAKRGRIEAGRTLLSAGADIEQRDFRGRTAEEWAHEGGYTYLEQLLRIAGGQDQARVSISQQPTELGDGVIKPPTIAEARTRPVYTQEALAAGIQGTVILGVVIRKSGRVGPIRIDQSLDPGLDAQALEAVKYWRFQPAEVDGEPINVLAAVEISFVIEQR